MKKTIREVNGYYAIYLPDHPRAYTSENWVGWVYEHIVVAEASIGRPLNAGEVVHHLDGNKKNNRPDNIVVLATRRCHKILHDWIDSGAKMHHSYKSKNIKNWGVDLPKCKNCDNHVLTRDSVFCSKKCMSEYRDNSKKSRKRIRTPKPKKQRPRKVERPSADLLIMRLQNSSYLQVGKDYGVSDNAVRKWVRSYGYDPKTLEKISQPE